MLEYIIVGIIILAAAGYALYRIFFRPSCGCGTGCENSSCGCVGPGKNRKRAPDCRCDK